MNDFAFYFNLGYKHILSVDALDHLLFIIALAAIYLVHNWKQILILVTAFTIGHSVTLILSTHNIISVNDKWIEFFIPLTIVITVISNFFIKDYFLKSFKYNYFLAAGFGLIHGMGFAIIIRFMLTKNQSIALPLFSFNVGLEMGQVIVVALILLFSYIVVNIAGLPRKWWIWGLSSIALLTAAKLCINRYPS